MLTNRCMLPQLANMLQTRRYSCQSQARFPRSMPPLCALLGLPLLYVPHLTLKVGCPVFQIRVKDFRILLSEFRQIAKCHSTKINERLKSALKWRTDFNLEFSLQTRLFSRKRKACLRVFRLVFSRKTRAVDFNTSLQSEPVY